VTAKRSLQNVQLNYSINGGAAVATGVEEWEGGERYGETHDVYYGEFRGIIEAQPGDEVEVWFTGANPGGGQDAAVRTAPFTYTVHNDIGGDVLVLAVEDTTGISPVQGVRSAKYADEHARSRRPATRATSTTSTRWVALRRTTSASCLTTTPWSGRPAMTAC
jgi:hypothetical protein